jgi:hypothetical protein
MERVFYNRRDFNEDIGRWNVGRVTRRKSNTYLPTYTDRTMRRIGQSGSALIEDKTFERRNLEGSHGREVRMENLKP